MKVAIVTGGTKGIGNQIVQDLLSKGYFVYTNYANDDAGAALAHKEFEKISESFEIYKADQSDVLAFSNFVNHISRKETVISCIVCNAGMTLRKPAMKISNDEWLSVMQVVVNSHFYLIRDLYNLITNNSRIVFIGSMMGILPHATSLPYGVAKSALHALAKNLVKEFEGTGTTINVIAPGFVETEWQKDKPNEIRENIYSKSSIKRFATVSEISNAVIFCIDNGFINGSIMEINGGYCCK